MERDLPAEEVDDFKLFGEAFVSSDSDIAQLERRLIDVYIAPHRYTSTTICKITGMKEKVRIVQYHCAQCVLAVTK